MHHRPTPHDARRPHGAPRPGAPHRPSPWLHLSTESGGFLAEIATTSGGDGRTFVLLENRHGSLVGRQFTLRPDPGPGRPHADRGRAAGSRRHRRRRCA